MPKKPRESRGQEARSTVTWLAKDQRQRPAHGSPRARLHSHPLHSASALPAEPHRPPRALRPRNEGPRRAAPGAARRGADNLDTYLPLERYTINERGGGRAPGKVQGPGGRPRGPAADRGRWARCRRSRPAGMRHRGAAGLPCRDLDLLGWAKPSAVGAQDHVWFCGFFFSRGRVAPTGGW